MSSSLVGFVERFVSDSRRRPGELQTLIDAGSHVMVEGFFVEAESPKHPRIFATEHLESIPADVAKDLFVLFEIRVRPMPCSEPIEQSAEGYPHVEKLLRWSSDFVIESTCEVAKVITRFARLSHQVDEFRGKSWPEHRIENLFQSGAVSGIGTTWYPTIGHLSLRTSFGIPTVHDRLMRHVRGNRLESEMVRASRKR